MEILFLIVAEGRRIAEDRCRGCLVRGILVKKLRCLALEDAGPALGQIMAISYLLHAAQDGGLQRPVLQRLLQ